MSRPHIVLDDQGRICHLELSGKACNTTPAKVVMDRLTISVGCTDISIEAAKKLLALYDAEFGIVGKRKVIQDGNDFSSRDEIKG